MTALLASVVQDMLGRGRNIIGRQPVIIDPATL
jgi:hypothetical protein